MAWPAGFGAFAMMVKPPPVTAPATSAYLNPSDSPSTSEPRYVSAALSVKAVRTAAPKKTASLPMPINSGVPDSQPKHSARHVLKIGRKILRTQNLFGDMNLAGPEQ